MCFNGCNKNLWENYGGCSLFYADVFQRLWLWDVNFCPKCINPFYKLQYHVNLCCDNSILKASYTRMNGCKGENGNIHSKLWDDQGKLVKLISQK